MSYELFWILSVTNFFVCIFTGQTNKKCKIMEASQKNKIRNEWLAFVFSPVYSNTANASTSTLQALSVEVNDLAHKVLLIAMFQ